MRAPGAWSHHEGQRCTARNVEEDTAVEQVAIPTFGLLAIAVGALVVARDRKGA